MTIITITNYLKDSLNTSNEYIILFIYSIISFIIYKLLTKLLVFINKKMKLTDKQLYQNNQINKTILSILLFIYTNLLFIIYFYKYQLTWL